MCVRWSDRSKDMQRTRSAVGVASLSVSLFLAVCAADALAEKKYGPGVTDTEIKIGQTIPYSGPGSSYATIGRAQTAYFAKVNAEGGVNGRKIALLSFDDGYSPPKQYPRKREI